MGRVSGHIRNGIPVESYERSDRPARGSAPPASAPTAKAASATAAAAETDELPDIPGWDDHEYMENTLAVT